MDMDDSPGRGDRADSTTFEQPDDDAPLVVAITGSDEISNWKFIDLVTMNNILGPVESSKGKVSNL